MNWEAIGATAEGLGAAGVLITLIYLVGQVRTNNRLIFSEGRRSAVQNINQLGLGIADNRQMAELFVAGLKDPEAMDQVDRIRFTWLMAALIAPLYATYTDRKLGLIPAESVLNTRESHKGLLDSPGGRWWWENRKRSYDKDFVEYIGHEFFSGPSDT
jgi:hypothetical protein